MEELFEEAKSQFMLGHNEKAEELYTKIIDGCSAEVESSDGMRQILAEAFNNRGQIKYLRVDFDEAVEDYTAAIGINDSFATAYYNRGQIHYRLARFKEGIEDFQKSLEYQPDFSDAATALQTAQEDLQRSVPSTPDADGAPETP
ncbi:tetratricopeptide repeat protein 32-like [Acanthaster planci]|uniref:Tetratricopeptide repeat protein 32-like n=1 Tax=Acanthaster planci TaxID=133434 RepID=A0A8B7XRP2_ACAPL|nr:tetratricopeptide repeat protein 32-like [Acanthaster planci]